MERFIEFKNIQKTTTTIASDLYLDGKYVMRFMDNIDHLNEESCNDVTLCNYFKTAMIDYLSKLDTLSIKYANQPFHVDSSCTH